MGASETSANYPDPSLAKNTSGPEVGGQSHIGTTSPETAGTNDSIGGGDRTAAIGTTSTYSTTHLTKGDPTSSLIDIESADPVTYKKPETSSYGHNAGVPQGSAQTAASRAFKSSNTHGGKAYSLQLDTLLTGFQKVCLVPFRRLQAMRILTKHPTWIHESITFLSGADRRLQLHLHPIQWDLAEPAGLVWQPQVRQRLCLAMISRTRLQVQHPRA